LNTELEQQARPEEPRQDNAENQNHLAPREQQQSLRTHLYLSGDPLEFIMAPGDVLIVRGSGRLAEIGAAGGLFGHALLAVGPPRRIEQHTQEAQLMKHIWPLGVIEIWRVATIESTRRETGLYQSEVLIYIERGSRRLMICGEVDADGDVNGFDRTEAVELWQSPEEIRSQLRLDVIGRVVAEMHRNQACWSATTAARAVLKSAQITPSCCARETLAEIKACWEREPICTSVIIIFWQRYLEQMATVPPPPNPWGGVETLFEPGDQVLYWSNSYHRWCEGVVEKQHFGPEGEVVGYDLDVKLGALPVNVRSRLSDTSGQATDLILKFMPLKADRALPGDLLRNLKECSWPCITQVPMIFRQAFLPGGPPPMPPPEARNSGAARIVL